LADAPASLFHGATVTHTSNHLGSYEMGTPGFVGLRLKLSSDSSVWVVFTIWLAAGWLTINDDLLLDGYFPNEQQDLSTSHRSRPLSQLTAQPSRPFRSTKTWQK